MQRWLAPAKVNLSLRILGKREDGFHELESFMIAVSLSDVLRIGRTSKAGITLNCSDPTLPCDGRNLVVQASEIFFEECRASGREVQGGVQVELRKEIPHGAGLGGGSSDAGTMLLALNALFAADFSMDTLASLASRVGSDVPFFLHRKAAWIRGRGERVEPVEDAPSLELLMVKPPFGVPTPWAYRLWMTSEEIPGISYDAQRFAWGDLVNDLERPVFQKYLLLADLKQWLLEQPEAEGALMSGSGATVFAVIRPGASVNTLRTRLLDEFGPELWTTVCRTLPHWADAVDGGVN